MSNCKQSFGCQWSDHCSTIEKVHRTEQSEVKQCQHKVEPKSCTNCRHHDCKTPQGYKCNAFNMTYPNDRACAHWDAKDGGEWTTIRQGNECIVLCHNGHPRVAMTDGAYTSLCRFMNQAVCNEKG